MSNEHKLKFPYWGNYYVVVKSNIMLIFCGLQRTYTATFIITTHSGIQLKNKISEKQKKVISF